MSARLIFSLLTSCNHDCLAKDEGFGTGDTEFFVRAEKRLKSFIYSAGTLLCASHSEALLTQFCTRGIVFNHGSIFFDGNLDEALKEIRAELLIVGFYSDWLYPPERGKEIQIAAINNNIKSSYVVLDGEHGHDSFLFHSEQYSKIIKKFIQS